MRQMRKGEKIKRCCCGLELEPVTYVPKTLLIYGFAYVCYECTKAGFRIRSNRWYRAEDVPQ